MFKNGCPGGIFGIGESTAGPTRPHFGWRRQTPTFMAAGRSGNACGTRFVPCQTSWRWGKLPDEVCIFIEDCIVVEVGQNHEALVRRVRLLPILDNSGDDLFFSFCLRIDLHVCQQEERAHRNYCSNDSSRACPSRWSHITPDQRNILRCEVQKDQRFQSRVFLSR